MGEGACRGDAQERYQFISFNLDGLPDAGESILRELVWIGPRCICPADVTTRSTRLTCVLTRS